MLAQRLVAAGHTLAVDQHGLLAVLAAAAAALAVTAARLVVDRRKRVLVADCR